ATRGDPRANVWGVRGEQMLATRDGTQEPAEQLRGARALVQQPASAALPGAPRSPAARPGRARRRRGPAPPPPPPPGAPRRTARPPPPPAPPSVPGRRGAGASRR